MNSLEYFHNRLDQLTGLIDVSDEQVYDLIKDHKHFTLGIPLEQMFGNKYENYSNLIATSVLVLGLSHFEDFLSKCIAVILTKHPERNDLRVTLKIIQEHEKQLISYLAESQGKKMTFSEKIIFIEKNISGLDTEKLKEIKFVYNIRNCFMHNNGHADLSLNSKYSDKQKIILSAEEVNGYGLLVRYSAKEVWDKLCVQY